MKTSLSILLFILVLTPYHNGDLNHDDKVSITDLVIMRQMVEGIKVKSVYSDLNYDGIVDDLDLQIMRIKLSKLNHSEVKVK